MSEIQLKEVPASRSTAITPNAGDVAAIDQLRQLYNIMRAELAKVIIGQHEVIEKSLIAIFTGNHALIEGVPGVAKTLLVRTLAHVLGCEFARIQFTLLSRELGLDYRLKRGLDLRAEVTGIEAMQAVLVDAFPNHIAKSVEESCAGIEF